MKGWSCHHVMMAMLAGDKKNFSGKQMVMELKALTEPPATEAAEGGAEGANAAPEVATSPGDGFLSLPFKLKGSLERLHDDSLELMIFAAKLSFTVFDEEVEEKCTTFWDRFVRRFFACADLESGEKSRQGEAEEEGGLKPLLIVSPDASEEGATREGRPPENRFRMPMRYAKTSSQEEFAEIVGRIRRDRTWQSSSGIPSVIADLRG